MPGTRCENCSKFVSLDDGDPEADLKFTIDESGLHITGTVRIIRICADCGEEKKEATFDIDEEKVIDHDCTEATDTIPVASSPITTTTENKEDVTTPIVEASAVLEPEIVEDEEESMTPEEQYTCEIDSAEPTSRTEGSGHDMKTFYGFHIDYNIMCNKCKDNVLAGEIFDDIQASNMDEI